MDIAECFKETINKPDINRGNQVMTDNQCGVNPYTNYERFDDNRHSVQQDLPKLCQYEFQEIILVKFPLFNN